MILTDQQEYNVVLTDQHEYNMTNTNSSSIMLLFLIGMGINVTCSFVKSDLF